MAVSAMTLSSVYDDGLMTDRSIDSARTSQRKGTSNDLGNLKLKANTSTFERDDTGLTFNDDGDELVPPPNGRLTKTLVQRNLSDLGRAGDGTTFGYRSLELISLNLNDIGALASYQFIRHLNLSNNNLTTLVVLSNMPWLVSLNASHNKLETLLDFQAPQALRTADFSYNQIRLIADLSEHCYIESLNLDHNEVMLIEGLENCRRLKELRLSHNRIQQIQSLGRLPIQKLDLSFNQLTKIEGLEKLELLADLDLSGNKIRSLQGIRAHNALARLELGSNEIIDLAELDQLRSLFLLQRGEFSLNLANNPLCELPDFRLHVIHMYPNLAELNHKKVRTEERVAALYAFSPPLEHVAAVNHSVLSVYSFLQPAVLEAYTLPDSEMCYPMLVIVGPDGSGREYLMMRLANEFPDVFSIGALCTTRTLYSDELDGREFAHIPMELFDSQVKSGQFLSIYNQGQHVCGFHKQSLEQAAAQGTACVTHMELEGMLCLRLNSALKPRYVLVVPMDPEAQDGRLRGRGVLSDHQIQEALARREFYVKYHQRHPGYFDAVIASDNLEEAYVKLKSLVLDYLGRSSQTMGSSKEISNIRASGDFEKASEHEAAMVKAIMAGSLVQRNDAASPSNSNTLGTEKSLYRVRYEALQRVMSGGRKSAEAGGGLKDLMSPRKQRQSQSAGGRNVVALPRTKSPNVHSSSNGQQLAFGVNATGNVDIVDLSSDSAITDDSKQQQQQENRSKTVTLSKSHDLDSSTSDEDDMALDSVRGFSSKQREDRLGSAKYNVLPPIRSVSEQTTATETRTGSAVQPMN